MEAEDYHSANGPGLTSFAKDDAVAGARSATATVSGAIAGAHAGIEGNGRAGTPAEPCVGGGGGDGNDAGGKGRPRGRRSRPRGRPNGTAGGRDIRSGHR